MKTLVLDATTKSLMAKIGGAPATTQPNFISAWADWTGSAFTPGDLYGALNSGTYVTIVAAPAASTQRTIKDISIVNMDTVAVTLTVALDVSTVKTVLATVVLQPNDVWTTDGTYDSNGNLKTVHGTSAQVIADTIHAATTKATPVDADELGIWDSVALILKKLTWANLKATFVATANTWSAAQTHTAALITSKGATLTPAAGVLTIDSTGDYYTVAAGSFSSIATSGGSSATGTRVQTGVAREITLEFEGAGTVSHGSPIILPGATNIPTYAGLAVRLREESANVWRCIGGLSLPVIGVTDGSSAATGVVGECLYAVRSRADALTIVTDTTTNILASPYLVLTPGDWDLSGLIVCTGSATAVTAVRAAPSTNSTAFGNPPTTPLGAIDYRGIMCVGWNGPAFSLNQLDATYPFNTVRVTISANQILYLIVNVTFSGGGNTASAYGHLMARRAR